MEFDLTTFVLEMLNFLILVWLLKHFFYQPVLTIIEKRQAATEKIMVDATNIQEEAEGLKSQYETKMAELDKEYATQKARIDEEMSAERMKRLASLDADIAIERKRRETLEEQKRSELERALERQAIHLAARFATRLLERVSGPELNAKLIDLAINELNSLTGDKQKTLRNILHDSGSTLKVVSAYHLDEQQRTALTNALSQFSGQALVPEFSEDPALKAGISIMAGSWVMMANLRDELSFFTGNFEHDS
ncbi:MAG: F0F1 ATP synthase subunit delta [Sulfurovum sp.]|nr:F0F1 ATP synthase subunit delta [Sulfurovum sp.]